MPRGYSNVWSAEGCEAGTEDFVQMIDCGEGEAHPIAVGRGL
jgi:hypothetical protein